MELIINRVKDIAGANQFFLESNFIDELNQLFEKEPKEAVSAFRKLDKKINLDYVLCRKEDRKFDNGSCFSYKGNCYMILRDKKALPAMPRSQVSVLSSPRFGLKAKYKGEVYDVVKLDVKPKRGKVSVAAKTKKKYRPPSDHPWKRGKVSAAACYQRLDRDTYNALLSSKLAWEPNTYID